ncbi:MAG TPA: DUF4259 domain-containing protein [Myxococcaceae bacterium]|nr:DUF4259 domain-containing protein [Myxococcaceae bacterium]
MLGRRWLSQRKADPGELERALDAVAGSPEEHPLAPETVHAALAASELVAASVGKPAESLPAEAHALVERWAHDLRRLRKKARDAVEHLAGTPEANFDSRDVYDEPDAAVQDADADAALWRTRMDELALRLADD